MRISDWSSDVCSSDLHKPPRPGGGDRESLDERQCRGVENADFVAARVPEPIVVGGVLRGPIIAQRTAETIDRPEGVEVGRAAQVAHKIQARIIAACQNERGRPLETDVPEFISVGCVGSDTTYQGR